jgi:hypothetical protein
MEELIKQKYLEKEVRISNERGERRERLTGGGTGESEKVAGRAAGL